MINKKGFEFSFGWIFSVLVGAVIIFLAIYASTKIINSERYFLDSAAAKQFSTILNPLETGSESGKISIINLPSENKIFLSCDSEPPFGKQKVSIAEQSSSLKKNLEDGGAETSISSKYIFSSDSIEGKSLVVFSKPFFMPFKVADLIYIIPEEQKYCFINPPNEIEDEILDLRPMNFNVTETISKCPKQSLKVCFSATGCDIDVNLVAKTVRRKKQAAVYYEELDENNALLYGAIFADSSMYECQIKRIMLRTSELAGLYKSKADYLSPRGCPGPEISSSLALYSNLTSALNNSRQLRPIKLSADSLAEINDALSCFLFKTRG